MKNQKIGVAMTGSFCTFSQVLPVIRQLARSNEVTVVLSPAAAETDTRFYRAEDLLRELEQITGRKPMRTIAEAEQVGPGKLFDVLLAAPCTGNTLAKLACGIADTPVTLAAKAHLRNARPLVLAVSTNDALAAAAKNIGELMNRREVYFVPFRQDAPKEKPRSAVADFGLIEPALKAATEGVQAFPMLL